MDEYNKTESTVTLTNEQWNALVCYILITTQHRKGEREAWEELATETDENGQPKFPNAQSNADYYAELEIKLKEIQEAIDNRNL